MKDITFQIRQAINIENTWSVSIFFDFINEIKSQGLVPNHWAGEENWATVDYEGKLSIYLWKKYPMMFVSKEFEAQVGQLKKHQLLEIVVVNSFVERNLVVTDPDLEYLFEYGVNLNGFSVEEFWFYTNSI
ncbi:hypothetical protein [Pedobacter sp. GR22-6]|uniref:hypothetical protein n=1 Tax=Pedobacter sp. GR22-6 TaxID=3127957 RepID=UPI00307F1575